MTSPYAPHKESDVREMLEVIGADSLDELFDIPQEVRYSDSFGIDGSSEREVRQEVREILGRNKDVTEFLGRGHYTHYVPSIVDHLSLRSEYLTSYTQYQPEVAQGFLQALFEYQSLIVELTGLEVVNSSMYDHATALGEAALLAARVRDGNRVLVPGYILENRESVLRNYVVGAGLDVEKYPLRDGNADLDELERTIDDDVVLVYVESPSSLGTLEEDLRGVADVAHTNGALCCLGSDPIALSILDEPAGLGVDVVVGDAGVLGLPTSYGMGLGLFAAREEFLRSTPGRLVGAGRDLDDKRAYTLTLQTREQHIRKERATSNICTNQAWLALRTAIHAAWLGPSGLLEVAEKCVELPRELAGRFDDIGGVTAPIHDRHHFREFVLGVDGARGVAERLLRKGYAVHHLGNDELQVCVTDSNEEMVDGLVEAFREVV